MAAPLSWTNALRRARLDAITAQVRGQELFVIFMRSLMKRGRDVMRKWYPPGPAALALNGPAGRQR